MNADVLILLHPGFEELEACAPIDILRRGDLKVVTASTAPHRRVTGRSLIPFEADVLLDEVAKHSFRCLVIPGGPGIQQKLRADKRMGKLAARIASGGGLVAAICAAPLILADAGLLEGKRYTAHPSTRGELPAATGEVVTEDGNLITSSGAGTAVAFALAVLSRLKGSEVSAAVAESICLP